MDDCVYVDREALAAIVAHARAEAPRECCGLLVGAGSRILEAVPLPNVDPSPERRFQVDPRDHINLRRSLRGSGRSIAGVYHSHPGSPAVPSPSDVAEALYPDYIHLIVSLLDAAPETRAYRIIQQIVREVRLVTGEEPRRS
jgi:proteasome lid subunit RPN8/RPN11